jgi:three-Cys-motif partner protein
MGSEQLQMFGGDWTEQKLQMLTDYLDAYATALKNQPFQRWYIDAFAGTGYREMELQGGEDAGLFPELAEEEPQRFLDGSARRALRVRPAFHRYVFIEKSPQRFAELTKLKAEFPDLAACMSSIQEDCNAYLRNVCREVDWARTRAVLFLDPFGMQVEWQTVEAVAKTRAVDMWILFPLSAVNRLLTRSGDMPESWAERLTTLFGTEDWRDEFYTEKRSLWKESATMKTADFDAIGRFFMRRLREVFAGVAENPRILYDAHDHPLFLFCFAAANERGARIAKKIAEYILKG